MNIWKYLHHLVSGIIILGEGIVLIFLWKPIFFSFIFIIFGLFLVIDDIIAETKGKSLIGKIHPDPIKLKIIGIFFFLFFEFIFIIVLLYF
ncbi:MAG: hypothetical protein ACFFCE_15795 [Promethearchaeota archaeon]